MTERNAPQQVSINPGAQARARDPMAMLRAGLEQRGITLTPAIIEQIKAAQAARMAAQHVAGAPRPMQAPPSTVASSSQPSMPPPSTSSFHLPPPSSAAFAVPSLPAKRKYPPEDSNRLVPIRGLDYMMKATGLEGQGFKLDPATESSLMDIYDDLVTNALQFGCSNAKRRPNGASLRPADIAVYMERTHHITVPGFGNVDAREVRPYRKVVATELHKSRLRVARETLLEEDRNMAKASRKGGVAAGDLVSDVAGKGRAIVSVLGPQAALPKAPAVTQGKA